MRCIAVLILLAAPVPLIGQRVVIKGATPGAVIHAVTTRIIPQGFRMVDSTDQQAVFLLPSNKRRLISVSGGTFLNAPVSLELRFEFKENHDGLEVKAVEWWVAERGRPLETRDAVNSHAERDVMQRFLDDVKKELESKG